MIPSDQADRTTFRRGLLLAGGCLLLAGAALAVYGFLSLPGEPVSEQDGVQPADIDDGPIDDGVEANGVGSNNDRNREVLPDYDPPLTPALAEIPENGTGENFELVGHNPLHDDHQFVGNESFGVPRGSNGEITIADDCLYVGSFHGYQPPLVVDIADPTDPTVVESVPDAVPGVGNGIEGIEASGDVLAIEHRSPARGMGPDVPDGMPERGFSVWDISDCRSPELVDRYDAGDLDAHALRLWRDSGDADTILAVQTYLDSPNIRVVDLTGCPDAEACDPTLVAEWELESQFGVSSVSHEAMLSPDGTTMHVAQPPVGYLVLDSSNLVESVRGGESCDPASPHDSIGEGHCLSTLDPNADEALEAQTDADGWHHTLLDVHDRPYMLALSESSGPGGTDESDPEAYAECPGGSIQLFGIAGGDEPDGESVPGTLEPDALGTFTLPEQQAEHCLDERWDPDEAAWPAWLSPHFAMAFPDITFVTYYSSGLRAIDISDPENPQEVGHFFNEPVSEVRWAAYGVSDEPVTRDDGSVQQLPLSEPMQMFAFSYPVAHDGYLIYGDVHSGIYVLEYTGPHADRLPEEGTCLPANPGGIEPGYAPCPPYGGD